MNSNDTPSELETVREDAAVVCAWCTPQKVIKLGTLPATHGICDDCQARAVAEVRDLEEAKAHE